jgi:hypothetical protein
LAHISSALGSVLKESRVEMKSISVKRTVIVKTIVTEKLKEEMLDTIKASLNRIELELQQMEFQGKRTLSGLEKQNVKQAVSLRQQLETEREKRLEAKKRLQNQQQEVAEWQIGDEVTQGTLEGYVDLKIGDSIRSILGSEIVVKDGVVVEIRE